MGYSTVNVQLVIAICDIFLASNFNKTKVNPTYTIPAKILHIPVGTLVTTNEPATNRANICAITNTAIAQKEPPIAFLVFIYFLLKF